MRRRSQYAFPFVVVVALVAVLAGSAWAQLANPYVSWLSSDTPGMNFNNKLTATVTQNPNGSYHYEYKLEFQQSPFGGPLTDFSVANPNHLAFTNPWCSDPRSYDWFSGSGESLYWYTSEVWPGNTVWFSFDSFQPYTLVDVTVGADYFPAGGHTLGMTIPEPGSLAALLMGIGAIFATRKRRC